ncbi:MAG: hypothetical protein ACI8PZ_006187 [Myxococcota bacterium]|jgi:hypothetical protein
MLIRASTLVLLLACGGEGAGSAGSDDRVAHVPEVDGDPLVPEFPLYPWPSDTWRVADSSTASGYRLAVPSELFPLDVPPEALAKHDGFTRVPALVTFFPGGVDPAGLPTIEASRGDDSAVWLVGPGGERVEVLAEIDANVTDPNRQALLIRPQRTLEPSTTYVAIISHRLKAPGGGELPESPAFAALRDGVVTDNSAVESLRDGFGVVLEAIGAVPVPLKDVALAWSFSTRSEAQVVGPTLAMHDIALALGTPEWVITDQRQDGDNAVVEGTFQAPDFLGPEGVIELDAAGMPTTHGERTVEFVIAVPDSVQRTRPVIVFGHGFFSAKEEILWGSLQQSLHPWEMSAASVDFIGFNEDDLLETVGALGGDLAALERTVSQQLQSHVHFSLLASLLRGPLAEAISVERDAGAMAPLDPDAVHYMGISNGGTQGATILAASPVLNRGALVVPGGGWSHMLQRAVQWRSMGAIIQNKYTDPLELQLVLSMSQQVLDPVDGLNYARGLVERPFEGRGPNEVTLHMAVEDSQVANLVTEWVARSASIPLLVPATVAPVGLDEVEAPPPGRTDLSSALYVYDEGYPSQPTGNVPPYEDNGAHETIRDLESYQVQVGEFLETGTIVQVCDGPCDPN